MTRIATEFRGVPAGLELPERPYLVLVGQNNSGKSSILQALNWDRELNADYVSPQRFNVSNTVDLNNVDVELQREVDGRKQQPGNWSEIGGPNVTRQLVALSDDDRAEVVQWHNRYFGTLAIEREAPGNEFSRPIFTVDGLPLSEQGTGSRSVLSMLCRLFDPAVDLLLVDEPELGLDPITQRILRSLFKEATAQGKRVIVATHSHLFLDREDIPANILVRRDGEGVVSIEALEEEEELHRLVFRMLGNSPDDLFFPNNVLIVEGPSDQIFMEALFKLRGERRVVAHYAGGDSIVGASVPAVDQMLSTTSYLPMYRSRIVVLVDRLRTERGRLQEWRDYLGDPDRVIELTMNGIEHYYPGRALGAATGLEDHALAQALAAYLDAIRRGDDDPPLGRFSGGKRALAKAVADVMVTGDLDGLSPEIGAVLDRVMENVEW